MTDKILKRTIPVSGEELAVIGMGTWQTFDDREGRSHPVLRKVLEVLNRSGGSLIDSSPMYGASEQVIGELTSPLEPGSGFFYATKVWTQGRQAGIDQMEASLKKMHRRRLDLIQVHNLGDWKTHLPTLRLWKAAGRVRYIGITHYTDSSHEELEKILRTEKLDFVQFNYSIDSRHAEKRLLDAAAGLGVATLINRPLGEGRLFRKVLGRSLPEWAKEFGICSWGAYFLKYLISHPAVTCVIPATSKPEHMAENLQAGFGDLPNQKTREKMAEWLSSL